MRSTVFTSGGRGVVSGNGRLPTGYHIGEGPAARSIKIDLPPFTLMVQPRAQVR